MPSRPVSPSDRVQELVWGALAAQVTVVLADLGVADDLAGGPRCAGAVAAAVGADAAALGRLLRAAASLGLLAEVDDDRFELTALGRTLRRDSPDSARDRVLAFGTPSRWRLLGELGAAVRTGRPVARDVLGRSVWEHYTDNIEEGEVFSRAMGELSAEAADAVAAIVNPREYRRIADIGGAHGGLLATILERAPGSEGVLFDLPPVVDGARRRLAGSPLRDRIAFFGGDFFDRVPEADLYLLMRVLHDWDDERARHILTTCRRAAARGARMLVVEQVLPEPRVPSPAHLSDIAMLVLLGGRERTASEYGTLLRETGWQVQEVSASDPRFGVLLSEAS
jgi:O-methyltransferase/methyltransferase family protein